VAVCDVKEQKIFTVSVASEANPSARASLYPVAGLPHCARDVGGSFTSTTIFIGATAPQQIHSASTRDFTNIPETMLVFLLWGRLS
jgi:hypothetical protein